MKNDIELKSRAQIAAMLPQAIESAMLSYQNFLDRKDSPSEKKSSADLFKDHHNACKVALAHVALLLKLAKWADTCGADGANAEALQEMMRKAELELEGHIGAHGND